MRSATAAVLMSGRADLKAETQDIDVIIVPEINAGAASLAYAAINPVIGISTFLAQLFLRSPLTEAGTREVHEDVELAVAAEVVRTHCPDQRTGLARRRRAAGRLPGGWQRPVASPRPTAPPRW